MEVDTDRQKNEQVNSNREAEEENEEILVYVNFEDLSDDYSNADLENFQVLGLSTDEPILQIGDKTFGGSWKETVGTAVFFEEATPAPKKCYFSADVPKPLKYIAKTQKCLNLKRVFVSPKEDMTATKQNLSNQNDEIANSCTVQKNDDIKED